MEEAERLADRIVVLDAGTVIAEGTAEQLKERLGGDLLEVRVTDAAQLAPAAAVLAEIAGSEPNVDPHQQRLTVPTKSGVELLLTAARRLQDAGIGLDDLGVRRPSLDDVFLALTGHATAPE
jgi:ABC-2 type transport system ATP-binding protein